MLYNYAPSYIINMININAAKKALAFDAILTKKIFILLKLFKKYGVIRDYRLMGTRSTYPIVRVYLAYYRNLPLNKNVKLLSTPSRTFYVSHRALRLAEKRTGSSIFFISTNGGIVTHKTAIQNKKGGVLIASFFI